MAELPTIQIWETGLLNALPFSLISGKAVAYWFPVNRLENLFSDDLFIFLAVLRLCKADLLPRRLRA